MLSGALPTTISRLSQATTTAFSLLRGRLHLWTTPYTHLRHSGHQAHGHILYIIACTPFPWDNPEHTVSLSPFLWLYNDPSVSPLTFALPVKWPTENNGSLLGLAEKRMPKLRLV